MRITVVLTAVILFLQLPFTFAQTRDFNLDKEYKISKTGIIDLNASDAKVFITGSARSTARIRVNRSVNTKGLMFGDEQFRVDVDEMNGDLRIRERRTGSNVGVMGYYQVTYKIEIEAPEGISLTVRGDDGDYYIKNINGAISLDLDDADVQLKDCKGDSFRFRLDDGDLTMDQGKGSIEIVGDDADIRIYNAHFTHIDADVDDGDLTIETTLADHGKYFIGSEDGAIILNITGGGGEFSIRHDDARIVTEGNFKLVEEREKSKKLILDNGSAKVDLRADDGRIRLTSR